MSLKTLKPRLSSIDTRKVPMLEAKAGTTQMERGRAWMDKRQRVALANGYATFGAAVTWLFLASLALPMDVGGLEWAYALRAVGSIVIGLTYGFSINAQQGREILKAPEQ